VISVAAGFPTTLNPVVQNGLIPVFVDVEVGTYNVDPKELERAIGPKTKAIFLAHTLGNPYDLDTVARLVKERGLWLIEDCCDALGSTYKGKMVGSFGHIATCSCAPYYDGRRRLRLHEGRDPRQGCALDPRLGSGLLLLGRREQYLREALLRAIWILAEGLRS
jgi:hypothetical protein